MTQPYNQLATLTEKLNDLKLQGRVSFLSGNWEIQEEGIKVEVTLIARGVYRKVEVVISNDEVSGLVDKVWGEVAKVLKINHS